MLTSASDSPPSREGAIWWRGRWKEEEGEPGEKGKGGILTNLRMYQTKNEVHKQLLF